jgi:ADP-heptose:LPS heptosyltransferase/GT2 family glycosyltransferase
MTRRPSRKAAGRSRPNNAAGQSPTEAEPTPPARQNRPAIQVELNETIDGWPTRSRFDVVLRGQITSTAPADSFSIRDPAGQELAGVQFGLGDAQNTVTFDGGDVAFRSGFQIYLPMPGGEGIRIADLWCRATGRDGAIFEQGMRLGCMADQAAILAGPAHDMAGVEIPAPRGIVYLESAEITSDGRLVTHGWTLATSPIVAVQIFVDGRRAGAATLGRERGDVAEAYAAYPNARHAGFVLERSADIPMFGGTNVTAQVLCLSGASLSATIPLVRPEGSGPAALAADPAGGHGNAVPPMLVICDEAIVTSSGVLRVDGWAAGGPGVERIAIEVDGRSAGDAEYGRPREDVAAADPAIPAGCGFVFERTIPGLTGTSHDIRIIAFGRGGTSKEITITVAPPPESSFRFELDGPKTLGGAAVQPITGRLVVEGWALARDGVAGIDVELDGTLLGQAHYGMARPDVSMAFPDWEGAARSGYNFHCPARALPDGEHVVQVVTRSKTGERHVHAFRVTVRKTDDPEAEASIRRRVKRVERDTMVGVLDQLGWRPAFHLVVAGGPAEAPGGPPAGDGEAVDAEDAEARTRRAWDLTFRSILEQSWTDWRVTVLAPDARAAELARSAIERLPGEQAQRFAVIDPSDANWGAGLVSWSQPSLVAVLASGDELGRDALGAFAVASGIHPRADCLYADEFRLPPGSARPEAFFKPDFSPALLLASNYVGRPLVVRPALLAASGVTASTLMRDGFHDLALRCAEGAREIFHVAELLSRTDGGMAPDGDARDVLERAMVRRGIEAEVLAGLVPQTWRVRQVTPVAGKVSIIVPTCAAKNYVETCLTTLREVTGYRNYEIVCIDNIPDTESSAKAFVRDRADKIVEMPAPFNWSRFNNAAAAASDGEFLLFLNDDIEIVQPDWLAAMLEAASWPGVGIVGARLLYPNRTVQHAGMFLGDGMGRHAFRHAAETDPGYFGLALTAREVIAVTGACLLVRREIFDRLGGFDEAHDVINNDMDFCLRAHRAGLRAIYTPHATLVHHELASRAHLPDDFDTTRFTGEWRSLFAAGDPYFNPHLSRYADDYRVDDEGVRTMYSGHPLLDRASVKAILVVKLDHIGDFITSLPAIRRLKAAFPGARLTALVAPASAAIAAVEPAIDECIPFEFFFERSELGEKELTEIELDALTKRLAAYRFDIAVDLRKHLSTRHLLLCAGARVLAGFDSLDNFPWLDVVLEWDGDKALQRKRSHIVDDLVNLVAAIDGACEPDRRLFDPEPAAMAPEEFPEHARHLFAYPVVAIHPGSGNVMRQWPAKHIPPLIDLLLEQNDVSVLLVGGRDDEEKAASILAQVGRADRIGSVAGEIALRDLPRVLAACALFIGGNSGPKHIAAASGVATIGIHSGVVDPGEWGPMGERTVALYRDMSCAPCFLAKPEHCPRNMACVEMLDPALVHKMAQMFLARPTDHRVPVRRLVAAPVVVELAPKRFGERPRTAPASGTK